MNKPYRIVIKASNKERLKEALDSVSRIIENDETYKNDRQDLGRSYPDGTYFEYAIVKSEEWSNEW